jgi:CubicO group peptidase (beta-lactamase class C family)
MSELAALLARASFATDTPLALARIDKNGVLEELASGTWPNDRPVATGDRFYAASLAKQVTGAALAVLVRDGRLDADAPLSRYLPDLPPWGFGVTARQLAHHVAGLPPAGEMEAQLSDWSDANVLAAIAGITELRHEPGETFSYSNLGYVLLAQIVAAIAGEPFEVFAQRRLFEPLNIDGIDFAGARIGEFAQLPALGPSLPTTVGDGGLWSTAGALARWLSAQNRDALGIASLVEKPARFRDGRDGDYGWGIGLREFLGEPLFVHGGSWTGAAATSLRSPSRGISVVAMAATAQGEELQALAHAMLSDCGIGS